MDSDKEFHPHAWGSIERLVERGQHPDPKVLAEKLRGDFPIPAAVRAYLAGLIEGKIQRPRGKPPLPPFERVVKQLFNPKHSAAREIKERVRNGQSYSEALAEVAAKWDLDENSLDNYYRRSRKSGIKFLI